jgi:hypothetical protein
VRIRAIHARIRIFFQREDFLSTSILFMISALRMITVMSFENTKLKIVRMIQNIPKGMPIIVMRRITLPRGRSIK